jgi:hypothetical protein
MSEGERERFYSFGGNRNRTGETFPCRGDSLRNKEGRREFHFRRQLKRNYRNAGETFQWRGDSEETEKMGEDSSI